MKSAYRFIFFFCLATVLNGCACTGGYLKDRGRDAADILTATVGVGAGAKARVGPVHAGLFVNEDAVGLRGGDMQMVWPGESNDTSGMTELDLTLGSFDNFFPENDCRHKGYSAGGILGFSGVLIDPRKVDSGEGLQHSLPYYTQIEVAAGLIPTLRLGFNPGELVDFLLGWFTIDIFADDLGVDVIERKPDQVDERGENTLPENPQEQI